METMLYTVGHGTLEAGRLAALLEAAGIARLADVRSVPGSRHNPQYLRQAMEEWLPDAGIDYRWVAELGGFRRTRADSPNGGLRHPSFRGYADYMGTAEFGAALAELMASAAKARTAIMCSESVWWRCHRRLIADAVVLVYGETVEHLGHDGRLRPHAVTPEAVLREGVVTYPPVRP